MSYSNIQAPTLDDITRFGNPIDPSRRDFFKKSMALLATVGTAAVLPRYLEIGAEAPRHFHRLSRDEIGRIIEQYNTQRAQDFILYGGKDAPEIIYQLGLEGYLRGSMLERELIRHNAIPSTYHQSSPSIAGSQYEIVQRLKKNSPALFALIAAACRGGEIIGPSDNGNNNQPPPPQNKYVIRGNAEYLIENGFVLLNGPVSAIADGRVVGRGQAQNGSYSIEFTLNEEGKNKIESVDRIRFDGNDAILSSELRTVLKKSANPQDEGRAYDATKSLLIGRIPPVIPDFFYAVNHAVTYGNAAREGHKKVVDLPVSYIADGSTNIGDGINQSRESRLAITRGVINSIHNLFTGFDNFAFDTEDRPSSGNGVVAIRYGMSRPSGTPNFDGYFRINGGETNGAMVDLFGLTDIEELSHTLWFLRNLNLNGVESVANDPSANRVTGPDRLCLAASKIQALGARKARAPDGTEIENYEP